MTGYSTQEVAEALGLSPGQVRAFARSGLLSAEREPGKAYRFSFQDIILLRTARELRAEAVPPRKIRRALTSLREQLPEGLSLSAVNIAAAGDEVVVRDRGTTWEPESGQVTFDFAVGDLADRVRPFAGSTRDRGDREGLDADGWYDLGWDLEAVSVAEAREAYGRALELRSDHAEARLNLGRLLHEEGRVEDAERQYRLALESDPTSALAAFNLGVALEDLAREKDARAAYLRALEVDPELASAHFNLARLCERAGDSTGALRHLAAYRRIGDRAVGG